MGMLFSPTALALVLAIHLISGAIAHGRGGFDWVHTLPSCWGTCLDRGGCASKSCICDSSQDGDYLTSAVDCAARSCRANELNVTLGFLVPLQMYCKATRDEIPDAIMSSAYACATATAVSATASPTRNVRHSTRLPTTSTRPGSGLESTVTSTVTVTTTNESGNTLQILIPVVMGPNTMTTGSMVTSTLDAKPQATPTAISIAEGAASTTTVPSEAPASPVLSATVRATNIGNGSPFDLTTQSGGSTARCSFSAALVGAGGLLGIFLGL